MQKSANADAIANVRQSNGGEDFVPAKWTEGGETDKDRTGWQAKGFGDKRWDPAVHGQGSNRMGKASVIHLLEDDTEIASWAEPAVDNALATDRERYLFTDADLHIEDLVIDPQTSQPAGPNGRGGAARADGGETPDQSWVQRVSIERPGIAQDAIVPVTSAGGFDGQAISWSQYQNLKQEQADQQTVTDAKNRAWAAAKLDDVEGRDLLKIAIIVGIWSFILLFHQDLGAAIAGLTGGGGGGGGGNAVSNAAGSALGMIRLPLGGV
jgi:hypothetical protein